MKPRSSAHNHAHGRLQTASFVPHPLLRNPHLQTIAASKLRLRPALQLRRERCELPDGDFIDIAWSGPDSEQRVILLHGLGGGFESKYALGMARQLHAMGLGTLQMQFRGAGAEANRLPRSYHSGDTADLHWLCQELQRRHPRLRLLAIGWSLGGNVLLKYLGEQGSRSAIAAAVAVSVPFLLREGAVRMRAGTSRIYQQHLLKELKAGVRRKFASMDAPIDLQAALQAEDFFAFDDACTAPLNGFGTAERYYRECSSRAFLGAIRVPTLILHAADDPFMSPAVIPEASELAPAVTLEVASHGGHVGFVGADAWGLPMLWLEQRIPAAVAEFCDQGIRPSLTATAAEQA